jgi:hypothetical protein
LAEERKHSPGLCCRFGLCCAVPSGALPPCITRAQTSPTKWLNSAPISFVLFGS